jgi:hypothetical protein
LATRFYGIRLNRRSTFNYGWDILWYDSHTESFYSLDFERQDEFNPAFFDILMTTYDLHMLLDIPLPAEKKPVQSQGQSDNSRRHWRQHGRGYRYGTDQTQQPLADHSSVAA